jgi:hypothetical protein
VAPHRFLPSTPPCLVASTLRLAKEPVFLARACVHAGPNLSRISKKELGEAIIFGFVSLPTFSQGASLAELEPLEAFGWWSGEVMGEAIVQALRPTPLLSPFQIIRGRLVHISRSACGVGKAAPNILVRGASGHAWRPLCDLNGLARLQAPSVQAVVYASIK